MTDPGSALSQAVAALDQMQRAGGAQISASLLAALRQLLTCRPVMLPVPEEIAPQVFPGLADRHRWAVERAVDAHHHAVCTVAEAANHAAQRDWAQRCDQIRSWMIDIGTAPRVGMRPRSAALTLAGERLDAEKFNRQLLGRQWDVLDELGSMLGSMGRASLHTGRHSETVIANYTQLVVITDRARRRMTQLYRDLQAGLAEADDDQQRAALQMQTHAVMMAAADTGARHVDAHTRRILDLDESTAAVSIEDWYDRCGLDFRTPAAELGQSG